MDRAGAIQFEGAIGSTDNTPTCRPGNDLAPSHASQARVVGSQDARKVWLWWVRPEAEPLWVHRQYLTPREWERAERFRSPADRCRFAACRAVLRRVLAQRLGTMPTRLELAEGIYGKPQLVDEAAAARWSFNVAHSGGLGCVALAAGAALGVDVEAVRQPRNLELMIRQTLTPQEQVALRRMPAEQRLAAFFRFWTCKEAVAKAIGRGLRLPLAEIAIDLERGGPVKLGPQGDAAVEFRVEQIAGPLPGYAAAIAIAGGDPLRLIARDWTENAA